MLLGKSQGLDSGTRLDLTDLVHAALRSDQDRSVPILGRLLARYEIPVFKMDFDILSFDTLRELRDGYPLHARQGMVRHTGHS